MLLLLWPIWVSAEQGDLVKKLHEAYSNVTYFEASFVQEKSVKFLSKPLVSKGHIQFLKNHGMVWEIMEPIWVHTKINESGIYKTNQFEKNKKVTDVQMKAVAQILSELLSSKLDRIESQFSISDVVIDAQHNRWQVSLSAASLMIKKAIETIVIKGYLASEGQSKGISQIKIIDPAGNTTLIRFIDIQLSEQSVEQGVIDGFK